MLRSISYGSIHGVPRQCPVFYGQFSMQVDRAVHFKHCVPWYFRCAIRQKLLGFVRGYIRGQGDGAVGGLGQTDRIKVSGQNF